METQVILRIIPYASLAILSYLKFYKKYDFESHRWLTVACSQLLIFFLSTSTFLNYLIFLEPVDPKTNTRSYLELIFYAIIYLQVQINFFATMLKSPGIVPKNWRPEPENQCEYYNEDLKKYLEYCQTCECFKPPRSHHCKTLNKCVLKYDHYCPWVGNSIGHRNQSSFVRFLFWLVVGNAWTISIVIRSINKHTGNSDIFLYKKYGENYREMTDSALMFNFASVGMSAAALTLVGMLFLSQLSMILANKTSIEYLTCWTAEQIRDRNGSTREFKYPYDLGCWKNFKTVFGKTLFSVFFQMNPLNTGFTDWDILPGATQYSSTVEKIFQKSYRTNLAKPVTAVQSYNGSWYPFWSFGIVVGLFRVPKTCESRLKLTPGDKVVVKDDIYWGSRWWYGVKNVEKNGKIEKICGWFPAKAVELDRVILRKTE